MVLRPPDKLAATVASCIKDAIIRGEYAPGSRLPEVALAAGLDTSRGTVREALLMLADSGLVEVIPRRGAFVTQLSIRATWEITTLRALLEPYASRLALEASGSDPTLLTEVEESLDLLREAITIGDPVAVAEADVAFHKAVFARCGHQMLLRELERLQSLSRRIVLTNQIYSSDAPTQIRQHAPIVAAVEARNPKRLEAASRAHVIEAGELLMARVSAMEATRGQRTNVQSLRLGTFPTETTPRTRLSPLGSPGMAAGEGGPDPPDQAIPHQAPAR